MKKLKSIFSFKHTNKNIVILIVCFVAIIFSIYNSITCFCDSAPRPWTEVTNQVGMSLQDFYNLDTNVIQWDFGKKYTAKEDGFLGHAYYRTILKVGYTNKSKVAAYIQDNYVYFCIFDSAGNFENQLTSTFSGVYIVEKNEEVRYPQNPGKNFKNVYNATKTTSSYIFGQYCIDEWDYYNTNVPVFDSLASCKNYALTGSFDGSVYVPDDMLCEKPLDLYVYHANDNENILIINWKQNEHTNLMYDCDVAYRFETESMTTDFTYIPLATNEKSQPINELSIDVTPILKKALLRNNGEDKIIVQVRVNNKDINGDLMDNNAAVLIVYMFDDVWWNDGTINDDATQDNYPLTNQDDFISGGGSTIDNNVVSSGGIFSQLSNGLKSIISTKDGFPALIASVWSGLPPGITSILVFGFLATIVICLLAHILKG